MGSLVMALTPAERALTLALAGVAAGLLSGAAASAQAPVSGGARAALAPALTLSAPLPAVVRESGTVIVSGRVHDAARGTVAAIELRRRGGWGVGSTTRPQAGGPFKLRWHVPKALATGPIRLRVVALSNGALVARTVAVAAWVGPAAVYCAKPAPPHNVPAGDGWVEGGEYIEGGAYPGVYECASTPYTMTARTSAGVPAASIAVAGGHSYTLVLAPGRYRLQGGCGSGPATVRAGQLTVADALCLVP